MKYIGSRAVIKREIDKQAGVVLYYMEGTSENSITAVPIDDTDITIIED